ncbi:4Fe-4S binding protein [Arhodomonas sp. AD133]|uniref:4Fe-4S binding protein n=1 Tax=Arhodomonas sp. AD133 TaxID=3415009 RepID=UPI003EB97EB9
MCTASIRSSGVRTLALVVAIVLLAFSGQVWGKDLGGYLAGLEPAELIPGADRFGEVQSDPAAAPVYQGGERVGYALLNTDYARAIGYSSKPIEIVIGIDSAGIVRGAELVEHHEPIVLIGIPEQRVRDFLDQFIGFDATAGTETDSPVDMVSGATVTVLVMEDSLTWAAHQAAKQLGLGDLEPMPVGADTPKRSVDMDRSPEVKDWSTLLEEGSVSETRLSVGDVNQAFTELGHPEAGRRRQREPAEATFIELYTALVSVPSIGRSLLGENEWRNLRERLEPGQHAVLVAGQGRYSFKGSGYVRGGIFDRIELVHGDGTVRFHDYQHKRMSRVAAEGAPDLAEVSVFAIPTSVAFDPAEPWSLTLLVQRATGPLSKVFARFELPYELPRTYLTPLPAPARATPGDSASVQGSAGPGSKLWKRAWQGKAVSLGLLAALLLVLTAVFFFQTWFTRRPRLLKGVRYGILTFVLVWLGWWANAQLSVVNVFTLTNAVLTEFSWSYFLMDPLVFVLWAGVAASLLFWARGAFCGWLCPFGALQELTNHIARRFGVRQFRVPFGLHERLWPIKYIIFLFLFGLSLYDLALAERLAEVEPFKTAIILNFAREWPYVIYALTLLAVGLFIERFFCRYLCPLGAALAIPARLRMFEWLKRWPECGTQCHRCARECPVQSIHPEGHINVNECISCLHCQELYFCNQRCPHNVTRRLKRERRRALGRRSKNTTPGETAAVPQTSSPDGAVKTVSWGDPRSSRQEKSN